METYSVKPAEPTVLAGQTHHQLKNTDLLLGFKVDTAHVVPATIDIERFNHALSRTLSVYPLYAGHMQRPREEGKPWQVRLANDGVPVVVVESDAGSEVPHNCIVQSPWTLSQGVKIPALWDFDSAEPLLRCTITRFVKLGSTCIGFSASHGVGDGFTVLQFLRLLSQNYQGLPPIDEPPLYTSPPLLPVSSEERKSVPLAGMDKTYTIHDVPPFAQAGRIKPERVDVHLTKEQVIQIQNGVRAEAPDADAAQKVSKQDAVSALLVYSMSKVDPDCLPKCVKNIVMDRGYGTRPATVMTNSLIWAVSDSATYPAAETPYSIARRIRISIEGARDLKYAAAWDAVHSEKLLQAVNADLAADFTQDPGDWVVNSTWRFDWTSAHFGYEGRVRFFHTQLDEPRFIKMFQPNPVLMPDGTAYRPAEVEITFYLYTEAKKRFKQVFAEELQRLGVQTECKWPLC